MTDKVQWEYIKLGELAEMAKGRTPPGKREEYFAERGLPWVKIENLKRKWICESAEYLSEKGEVLCRTAPESSVLLSVNGTIGRVGIAGVPLQTNEQIIAIICREQDSILSEYLYYYLMFSAELLRRRAYVTVNSRVSIGILEDTIVPLAAPEYRLRVVERLRLLEELVWKKEDMRVALKRYRAAALREEVLEDLNRLTELLEQSTDLAARLLDAALKQIFREAERKKEDVYYGGRKEEWLAIDEMEKLDEGIRSLLKEMSFFQQCLYRAFYSVGTPSAVHAVLKQVKKRQPSLEGNHIQDALAAVETFRQMGLMARQEDRKLYYTAEETEENEIRGEDGKNLTISLWGCCFPGQTAGRQAEEEEAT